MAASAQEERKEASVGRGPSGSAVSMTSSNQDEEYDTFDGDAVNLGQVNVASILASESQIAGQNRRVTS